MKAPIFIGELELTEPISGVSLPARQDGPSYTGARLLVRVQGLPVGYTFLQPDALTPESISANVWQQLSVAINAQRAEFGLNPLAALPASGIPVEAALTRDVSERPLITVVVCTRDRPASAIVSLRTLAGLRYEPVEIVVVDNAPSSDATKSAFFDEFGNNTNFRYVREPRPGLSCARNRGLREASADIVAFTDDDVKVDSWWLDGILRGFRAAPDVACVTGLIATAEIENEAQLYFHLRAGWGMVCEQRIFDLVDHRDDAALYPYSGGVFGSGANFAVSRKALKEVGDFDEALGAGTLSAGGEDLDMFIRVILGGYQLVYEPSAIVSHIHRTSVTELTKQMRAYGSALTASLTALAWENRRARREIPSKVVSGLLRVIYLSNRVKDNPTLPPGLFQLELRGMAAGPWLYLRSRRNLRRLPA